MMIVSATIASDSPYDACQDRGGCDVADHTDIGPSRPLRHRVARPGH
jgi:hypothetical protein